MKGTIIAAAAAAAVVCSITVAVAVVPPVLTTDAAVVTYPEVVTLTATATAGSPSATFSMMTPGAAGYSTLGTVAVSPANPAVHEYIVRPRRNASYTVEINGLASAPVYVGVRAPLLTPKVPALLRPGTETTITGTIRPFHPGPNMDVQLEKWNARTRRWESKLTTAVAAVERVNADTTRWGYKLKVTRSMVGLWRVRASHLCANHMQSYSPWKKFSVL